MSSYRDQRSFFNLVSIAILFRLFLPSSLLNLMYEYSAPGGIIPLKIHPGTYLIFGLALFQLFRRRIHSSIDLKCVYVLASSMILAFLAAVLNEQTSAVGFLVDTYLGACAAFVLVMSLPQPAIVRILRPIIVCYGLNVVLLWVEYLLKTPLISTERTEDIFRPAALTDHPLLSGIVYLFLIATVAAYPITRRRWLLIGLFSSAIFVSQVRFASLNLALMIVLILGESFVSAVRSRSLPIPVMVGGFAAVLMVAASTEIYQTLADGIFQRFATLGLFDSSAQSRLDPFELLRYLTPKQIWYGLHPDDQAYLMNALLGVKIIENAALALLFSFGVVGGGIVAFGVVTSIYFLVRRLKPEHKVMMIPLAIAIMGTITLSTKNPTIVLFFVVCACLLKLGEPESVEAH